jgi:hypothetical protein
MHIHVACDVQPPSIVTTDVTRHGKSPWLLLKDVHLWSMPITCTRHSRLVSLTSHIVRAKSDPSTHSEALKDPTLCNITLLLCRTVRDPGITTPTASQRNYLPHQHSFSDTSFLRNKLLLSPRPNGRLPYLPYFVAHVIVKLITQIFVIVH